ncbi:hypothetical protein FEK33_09230 [Nocardia asteroides NBRC 15531]|uniref:Uncharacterized protein n=1 Tax=Nocardia asteroides NBRC 15531 TaxID=1110697 RepID=U5E5P9_NOCAS|nr:hypothetical protein [Nocardia asteroides]TLF70368.1 hypothetical protein FEK33_09230 [Nocardia asteroides NBRC 15531]UGT49900.1 hypothetical protein LT345_04705 [Nocardia asteroides]SFN25845.1 hypothetical protein SAMN05444423_107268 [Nocardia asteroides]VEG37347.1 Uncharacterised protein [Nocardia asteroides]GAD81593.1 hypothetical protein NCAST_05_00270 [Nocardia asteroides NBRC 15531]
MWAQKPNDLTVWDIIARLAQEAEQNGRPSPVLDHSAPDYPLSREMAHRVLQLHRVCDRVRCARKAAAWMRLVELGAVVPRPPNGSM